MSAYLPFISTVRYRTVDTVQYGGTVRYSCTYSYFVLFCPRALIHMPHMQGELFSLPHMIKILFSIHDWPPLYPYVKTLRHEYLIHICMHHHFFKLLERDPPITVRIKLVYDLDRKIVFTPA